MHSLFADNLNLLWADNPEIRLKVGEQNVDFLKFEGLQIKQKYIVNMRISAAGIT
jgi:hypothetical protein